MWDKLKRRLAAGKIKIPSPSESLPKMNDDPKINEDWAVGDIAECISDGVWLCCATMVPMNGPRRGERYRVIEVSLQGVRVDGSKRWFIRLSGWHRPYEAIGFRKVQPKHDAAVKAEEVVVRQWFKKKAKA